MTPDIIVEYASIFAIVILVIALLLTVYRAVVGPTLPDRIVALDMLVGIVIGFIAVIALRTGYTLYVDIAIALGLVGFLATIAFARFILARGTVAECEESREPARGAPAALSARSSGQPVGNTVARKTVRSKAPAGSTATRRKEKK